MPSITIRRDGKPTHEVELEKGLTLIGQATNADIKIEDLEGIAERATILRVGDDFVLDEIGSSGGILVNGHPTKKRVLKDRDLILIGEYRLTYQDKGTKPVGVEMEVSEARAKTTAPHHSHKIVDPFHDRASGKSRLVIYVVVGAVVLGICYASYQSYTETKAADMAAAKANQARREAQRKEEASRPEASRAAPSPANPTESPAATTVTEEKH